MNIILNSAMFSTADCIFSENFIHNNTIIKVQLRAKKLHIQERFGTHVLAINHQTYFKAEEDCHNNLTAISIIGEKVVHLGHSNPTVLEQWSLLLSQLMHRVGFRQDYVMIDKIGEGISSSVYRARETLKGRFFAVKVFKRKLMGEKELLALQNEIRILRLLNNTYFPRLISTYISQQKYYLVMEFAEGVSLRQVAKRHNIDWLEKRRVFIEIAKALRILHSMNIVHRDVKPQNIVYNLKNGQIKVIDFGFSAYLLEKQTIYSNCGTPGYAVPESYKKNYCPAPIGDVFSLGILGYFLFFNEIPYQSQAKLLIDNRDCNFCFTKQLQKYPSLQNLLKKMICQKSIRMSLDDFFDHPFVKGKEQITSNPQVIFWHRKIQQKSKPKKQKCYQQHRQRVVSMALRSLSKTKYDSPLALYNKRLVTDRY